MRVLFYAALFLFIFALGLHYGGVDNDFWARLIVGKTFFQTGIVSPNDFLSYAQTHPWIDHEWGSSVVFYFLQENFGDFGLFLFSAIMNFAIFVILIEIIKLRHPKNEPLEFNFLFFFFAISAIAGLIFAFVRCQIFTFFFFALWLYILEHVRLKDEKRLLWILPATMLIWANLHGGCAMGFGLLGIYILGELFAKKPVGKYILALILSLVAVGINPYGLKYYEFLFSALTLKRAMITEWQGLFSPLHGFGFIKFKLYLFIVCALSGFALIKTRFKVKDATKALVLIVMFALCIKSVRFQPFFVFCVTAFLYDDFYNIFNKKLPRVLWFTKEVLLYGLVFVFFASSLAAGGTLAKVPSKLYPVFEVDFIKKNNIQGNVFSNFHFGSYIAYKLYPYNHINMDGRYEEVYYEDLLELLRDVHLAAPDWKKELNKYHNDVIIADKTYGNFYRALLSDKDWALALESEHFALFLPASVMEARKAERRQFIKPETDENYYNKTKFETNINWD